jgi:hypothetical protein
VIWIRWGLLCSGAVSIAVAMLFDLEFVRTNISADGNVEPHNVAALQIVRLALGISGGFQIVAGLVLDRLIPPILWFFASSRRARWTIFLTPFLILGALAAYRMPVGSGDRVYWILTQEDSVVEWATALAFLLGAGVAICSVRLAYNETYALLYVYVVALAFFFAFCGLEEISYGQRVFGFVTPSSIADINSQEEINIHNINSLSFLFFHLGPWCLGLFGTLGCALPLLQPWIGERPLLLMTTMLPPWFLSSWFVPYALFALYDHFFWGALPLVEWQDSEVIEALLAIGFAGFVWHMRSQLRVAGAAPQAQPGPTLLTARTPPEARPLHAQPTPGAR